MNTVNRTYQALTEEDKAKFLELTAAGWTFAAASAAVRPAATGPRPGISTLRAALDRDPDFQARYEDAQARFKNSILQEAIRRGIEGVAHPLSYKGKLTGDVVKKKSDAVLLRLLQGNFSEYSSQTVNHSGRIEHEHRGHVVIDAAAVYKLSPEQRNQLAAMLPILSGESDEKEIERQRQIAAPVIEAEFSEAEEEDFSVPEGGF